MSQSSWESPPDACVKKGQIKLLCKQNDAIYKHILQQTTSMADNLAALDGVRRALYGF